MFRWNNYFLYIVQFDLLEFQRFCFQGRSCHSIHTSSSWCEYRMNHCTEFVTGQNFLDSFSCHGVLYIGGVEATFGLWSFLIILTKQPTSSGLKIQKISGLRDCKSCQENVSLSLAKRKLAEKKWIGVF